MAIVVVSIDSVTSVHPVCCRVDAGVYCCSSSFSGARGGSSFGQLLSATNDDASQRTCPVSRLVYADSVVDLSRLQVAVAEWLARPTAV